MHCLWILEFILRAIIVPTELALCTIMVRLMNYNFRLIRLRLLVTVILHRV